MRSRVQMSFLSYLYCPSHMKNHQGVFGHGVKIDSFKQEYGVIVMVGLMIVSDSYHGCFHVFVTVRIGAAIGSICYLHAGNMVFGSPSCGKCSLCSLDLPDGRRFNVELKRHSNAINIAERQGLPNVVVGNACELDGTASAEINEVIEDMEKLKQKLHEHIHEARHHLKLARELHRNLVVSERRIREHATSQRYIKIQEISEGGGVARSLLHKKVRQSCAFTVLVSKADDSPLQPKMASFSSSPHLKKTMEHCAKIALRSTKVVKAGDPVHVSKFNKNAVKKRY
ncbi:hypothetical protein Tco_0601038 [Tanacetum coccineum]